MTTSAGSLGFRAPLDDYRRQADELFAALQSGDEPAAWRFKWEHPRFKGKTLPDVQAATLDLPDAQTVIAREYSFQTWQDLAAFTTAVSTDRTVARFEEAVEAVVSGDDATLRDLLREDPDLVRARSSRHHHCTLLHYLGANGVESGRQKTPPNAVEIATLLLAAGAAPDAMADLYDAKCTTMSMLVTSTHPAEAGLQIALAETLLDYGASFIGPGTNWQSAVLSALTFGYPETAEALVRRGAPVDDLPSAAGLGRIADASRFLPPADAQSRHVALALAAQLGRTEIVRLLLDAGEVPNRYNPNGYHSHATPLHQAAWNGHSDVVRLLVERRARVDIRDTIYRGTPLDWAVYGGKDQIADYLRSVGPNTTTEQQSDGGTL
ncbi:MAG TPA: ankyrin repeat domain-containing protein [Thermoanaerobaculia bacterium]|nr:ankyrin repeat domain-containing protein [Thermoanaerobaculia bacterium]